MCEWAGCAAKRANLYEIATTIRMAGSKPITEQHEVVMSVVMSDEKVDPSRLEGLDLNNLQEINPEWRRGEKKLVRKLDMTLMPIVWVLYLFSYLDRNNIG